MTLSIQHSNIKQSNSTIKFLYSYGGKIVPRHTDGKLIYAGGFTRVLAVDRSITFAELMVKLGELCGSSMSLKCKLPYEDLDLLVTITSDEELACAITEYDKASKPSHKDMKIRIVLFPHQSLKKISPPTSPYTVSSPNYSPSKPPRPQKSMPPVYQSDGRCCSRSPVYRYRSSVAGIPPSCAEKLQPIPCHSVRKWNQWL